MSAPMTMTEKILARAAGKVAVEPPVGEPVERVHVGERARLDDVGVAPLPSTVIPSCETRHDTSPCASVPPVIALTA